MQQINKNDFDGNLRFGGRSFHASTGRATVIEKVSTGDWGRKFFAKDGDHIRPKKEYFDMLDTCLMCGKAELNFLLSKTGMTIVQCGDCGFGFQNPRFKAERLHEIYEETYVMDETYSSPVAMELDKIKFSYGVQVARSHRPELNSVLDIGCGQGLSLKAYREAGIKNVFGMDPGNYSQDMTEGCVVVRDYLEEVPQRFRGISFITMWDVLEHIHDFKRLLVSVRHALDQEGLLLVMVPNLLSLASRLIREKSATFQVDHLNYFTDSSLTHLFHITGFEILFKETVISEIDNCRNYLEFQEPYFSAPKKEAAFDWLTPEYIHANMLGSRLLFIVKRGRA